MIVRRVDPMKNQEKYMLDRKTFAAKAAMICLFLSMLVRGAAAFVNRTVLIDRFSLVEFALPIVCCLLYILCIVLFGRHALWLSVIPFICGMMAFVIRLFSYDNLLQEEVPMLRIFLSIFFYFALSAVYSAVLFGGIRAKWLLFAMFLAQLCAHGYLEVYPAFARGESIHVFPILMELSVDLILIGMLFVSAGLSRKNRVTKVKPDSGKTVVPPVPGNKLDAKPPVSTQASPEPAAAEQPEEKVKNEPSPSTKPVPDPEPEAPVMPEKKEEAKPAEDEDAYDPFAPSKEPIKLTLNPVGFSVEEEKEPSEGDRV